MLATCQKKWDNNETIFTSGNAGGHFFQGLGTRSIHSVSLIITVFADENPHYSGGR